MILGGGFAGYYTARELEARMRAKERDELEITLIARDNFLTFTPMLPSVPASTLAPRHVVTPIRQALRHTRFVRASVTSVDPVERRVRVEGALVDAGREPEEVPYDDVVVGLGSTTHFFGVPGAAEHTMTMKTVPDAMRLRNRVLDVLEAADVEESERRRRALLTVVIVGVGFSGCETAGELHEFIRKTTALYPRVTERDVHVMLVGLDAECMPEIGARLGKWAREELTKDGVEVRLGTAITAVADDHVLMKLPSGEVERVETRCVVWTAGIAPVKAVASLATPTSKGRVPVDATLKSPLHEGLWALGDAAAVPNTDGEGLCGPTAQHAMRQAATLAKNLLAQHRGRPLVPYTYKPLGIMASLGHHKAVALAMGVPLWGFVAWWMWRTYYLLRMPGLERKIRVALDWTIDLFLPRDTVVLRYEAPGSHLALTPPPPRSLPAPPRSDG